MLNQRVAVLLNQQIAMELFSAYLYLDMANYYRNEGLDGFDNWFYVQAREEQDHAMLMRSYLLNNDERVTLLPIAAPGERYDGYAQPLDRTLEHELSVTAAINAIYSAASQAGDYRTLEFLSWFVKEQGEEEKNAADLIRKYALFGHDPQGLYQLDQELKARVYAAPTLILD